jgi:hypothetical protein
MRATFKRALPCGPQVQMLPQPLPMMVGSCLLQQTVEEVMLARPLFAVCPNGPLEMSRRLDENVAASTHCRGSRPIRQMGYPGWRMLPQRLPEKDGSIVVKKRDGVNSREGQSCDLVEFVLKFPILAAGPSAAALRTALRIALWLNLTEKEVRFLVCL